MTSSLATATSSTDYLGYGSVLSIAFLQTIMSELLFAGILLAAFIVGRYQSSAARKASSWGKARAKKDDLAPAQKPLKRVNDDDSSSHLCGITDKEATLVRRLRQELQNEPSDVVVKHLESLLSSNKEDKEQVYFETPPAARALMRDPKVGPRIARIYEQLGMTKELETALASVQNAGALARVANTGNRAPAALLAMKSALRRQDAESAIKAFVAVHAPSVPEEVSDGMQQRTREAVIQLASTSGKFAMLMNAFRRSRLTPRTFNAMLKDSARRADWPEFQACRQLGYDQKVPFNCASYAVLLTGADSSMAACAVFQEAISSGVRLGRLCEVAAMRAAKNGESALAKLVLRNLPEGGASTETADALIQECAGSVLKDAEVDAAVVSATVDAAVLGMYEGHFATIDLSSCAIAHQLVFDAAVRTGRGDLLTTLAGSESGAAAALRSATDRAAAWRIFESCPNKTTALWKVLLEVVVSFGDVLAAERILAAAQEQGTVDASLYVTVAEAQLRAGATKKSRATLASMTAAGFKPTVQVLNTLLSSMIKTDAEDCFSLIQEMEALGVKPDVATCSILLSQARSADSKLDVRKTVTLVKQVDGDISDIFGPFLEACLQLNDVTSLAPYLKRQRGNSRIVVKDAITYAHLIRAYGVAQDINGAWEAWIEMISRKIKPFMLTLGCMVQVLVLHGQPEAGYILVQEMRSNPETSGLVNAITCNSLIKGFGYAHKFDCAWTVFTEMKEMKVELTNITFNTLIDTCARNREMDRLTEIIEDMRAHGVEPDQITYNTIIKGLCHEKRLEQALDLREQMRSGTKYAVDAHSYAALIDGCSRLERYQRGFSLLDEMQRENVKPNNVTLSSLVRLAGFSHQTWALDSAFELCEQLSRKHGFSLNAHVYKSMTKACMMHGDSSRALSVLAQIASSGQAPDEETYVPVLLALAVKRTTFSTAVSVLRLAAGLDVARADVPVQLRNVPAEALRACGGLSASTVGDVLLSLSSFDKATAMSLSDEIERVAKVKLDVMPKIRLTCDEA